MIYPDEYSRDGELCPVCHEGRIELVYHQWGWCDECLECGEIWEGYTEKMSYEL